jgi:hypothetical protein
VIDNPVNKTSAFAVVVTEPRFALKPIPTGISFIPTNILIPSLFNVVFKV